jgi:VWFA-related protein
MRAAALLASVILLSGVTSATPQQPAPFTAATNLVVVPIVVVDRKGLTIPHLTAADFQITEDGKPVEIATFIPPVADAAGPNDGRFIVLVLDNLRTPAEIAFRIRAIAMRFVDRMGPLDVVTVIPISRGKALSTTDKAALKVAIDGFKPMVGEGIRTFEEDSEHVLRMIRELSGQMQKAPQRRKVMALIGNAGLFNPQRVTAFHDRAPELSAEWLESVRQTARDNISIYAIDPQGHMGASVADYSTSFAAETGGWAWANTNNYNGAVEQIWREAGSYYVLGYAAPVNDQKLHRIDVKVNVKGATVRARRARS